jgi:hypothetical protein
MTHNRVKNNLLKSKYASYFIRRKDITKYDEIHLQKNGTIVATLLYKIQTKDKVKYCHVYLLWYKTFNKTYIKTIFLDLIKKVSKKVKYIIYPNSTLRTLFVKNCINYLHVKMIRNFSYISDCNLISLNTTNLPTYKAAFMNLLTRHDISIAEEFNKSTHSHNRNTHLVNKPHMVKLNYFINSIVRSSKWYILLISVNDLIIGFVKCEVINRDYGRIDFYIKEHDDNIAHIRYAISKLLVVSKIKHLYCYAYTSNNFTKRVLKKLKGIDLKGYYIKTR